MLALRTRELAATTPLGQGLGLKKTRIPGVLFDGLGLVVEVGADLTCAHLLVVVGGTFDRCAAGRRTVAGAISTSRLFACGCSTRSGA